MGCIYAHILRNEYSSHCGWMYIGQAEDVAKRWAQKENSYRDCTFIYREMKKYGWDSFEHIIIEDNIATEKLDDREEYWIHHYHTYIHDPEYVSGFNLTPGGAGSRGPKMGMRGVVPKNIPMLTEMKCKPIKCLNSGIWKGKTFYSGQTWKSIKECKDYFEMSHTNIWQRLNNEWNIISGPIFAYTDENVEFDENSIIQHKEEEKNRQKESAKAMLDAHKTGACIDYQIYCEETGQYFDRVCDCLNEFGMSRATLNGHILYPDKHKTAKGHHFKRVPKINAAS